MANSEKPKKETVRIPLPQSGPSSVTPGDTVRVNLPSRPPSNAGTALRPSPLASKSPASTPLPPERAAASDGEPSQLSADLRGAVAPASSPLTLGAPSPKPPGAPPNVQVPLSPKSIATATTAPAMKPILAAELSHLPGPKKEMARISVLSDPPESRGSAQMKETQPLNDLPPARSPVAPVRMTPTETKTPVDSIPKSICWTVLGVSAAILLIEIWNYLS